MNFLTRHFTSLTDFSGRENREPFWLWVLALYIGQTVLGMVVMFPMQIALQMQMAPQFEAMRRQQEAGTPPDPQKMFALMAPLFTYVMIFSLVLGAVFLALLAAAVVRRLHDSGRSGYWAAPQFLFWVGGQAVMIWIFTHFTSWVTHPETVKDMAFVWFAWFGVFWLVGMILTILMIVLLCLPGTDGPNRYGDDPLAAYREARRQAYVERAQPRAPAIVTRPGERQWDDPA